VTAGAGQRSQERTAGPSPTGRGGARRDVSGPSATGGTRRLVATGLITFLALGAAQGLYGPLIPELKADLGVTSGHAGLVVSLHFVGVVLGMALWSRYGRQRAAAAAGAALVGLGVGAALLAVAVSLAAVLGAAALVGLCTGTLNVGFNSTFARLPGPSGARLSALSGCFAAGAVLGPAAVGLLGGTGIPFAGVAIVALATMPLLRRVPAATVAGASRSALRRRLVIAVGAIMLLYVTLETCAATWAATHLIGGGSTASAAAFWTAAFWGALACGRLLAAWLLSRAEPSAVILASLILAGVGAGVLFSPHAAPGYVLLGVTIAPVFPMTVAWLVAGLGVGERLFAAFFMAAQAAPVVVSAAIGLFVDAAGTSVVPLALTALLAGALVVALSARAMARRGGATPGPT